MYFAVTVDMYICDMITETEIWTDPVWVFSWRKQGFSYHCNALAKHASAIFSRWQQDSKLFNNKITSFFLNSSLNATINPQNKGQDRDICLFIISSFYNFIYND